MRLDQRRRWTYAYLVGVLAAVLVGRRTGNLDGDFLAAVWVLTLAYVCGGAHALYLVWVDGRRLDTWVNKLAASLVALDAEDRPEGAADDEERKVA